MNRRTFIKALSALVAGLATGIGLVKPRPERFIVPRIEGTVIRSDAPCRMLFPKWSEEMRARIHDDKSDSPRSLKLHLDTYHEEPWIRI